MLKQSFRTFTVAVLLVLATGLAYAQADVSKVEVGVQFNLTRLRDLSETDTGMGGRVVYNFNKMISAEAEFNYFPGDLKDFSRFFG
ncbi:MAG TPA: outer membrane beta-barrel protein, partial [Blastocatellia bacterium]|nr:outer membrane beta-barrel protein [Blastocatellia bacterium]